MKKSLVLLPLIALAFAGCEKKDPTQPTVAQKTEAAVSNAATKTKDAAIDAKDAIADKLTEWKLTPDDIKADLKKTGRVVRDKGNDLGTKAASTFDSAVITTTIKAKYVADKDLSALKIGVTTDKGVVTLDGTVASVDLIGKAVTLALDTDGVIQVVSLITVAPAQ